MFDIVPEYTGDGERVKNPKEQQNITTGIRVSGKTIEPELLYKLALMGANNMELGEFFGVSESQIRFYFNEYLRKARASLRMKLRRAQLKVAIENESTAMLIWLGKNILNQSDGQLETPAEQVLPWLYEPKSEDDLTESESE